MIHSELAKIRYGRSLKALLVAGVTFAAALSVLMACLVPIAHALIRLNEVLPNATDADRMSPATLQAFGLTSADMQRAVLSPMNGSFFGVGPTVLAIVLFGLLAVTTEYRFGSVVGAVLASPRRLRFLLAKLVAVSAVVGIAVTVLTFINLVTLLVAVRLQTLTVLVSPPAMLGLWGRAVLTAVGYAAIGMGVGFLLRSQVAAVIAVFLVVLAEPVLRVLGRLLSHGVTIMDFLPIGLAQPSAGASLPLPGATTAVQPGPVLALTVLLAWGIVLLGLGAHRFVRREISLD